MLGIGGLRQPVHQMPDQVISGPLALMGRSLRAQSRHQAVDVMAHAIGLVLIDLRDLQQHRHERRAAELRLLGKICTAEERPRLAIEKHRQRPAALFAERMERIHVDGIDVGPLLTVDLDVHVEAVHDIGGAHVLEALVRHHVAPVAGRISHRQQDGLARALGFRQRFGPPRPPMHRVVLVLEQVGARFPSKSIFGAGSVGLGAVF